MRVDVYVYAFLQIRCSGYRSLNYKVEIVDLQKVINSIEKSKTWNPNSPAAKIDRVEEIQDPASWGVDPPELAVNRVIYWSAKIKISSLVLSVVTVTNPLEQGSLGLLLWREREPFYIERFHNRRPGPEPKPYCPVDVMSVDTTVPSSGIVPLPDTKKGVWAQSARKCQQCLGVHEPNNIPFTPLCCSRCSKNLNSVVMFWCVLHHCRDMLNWSEHKQM